MITYFVYIVVALILLFVIYTAVKAFSKNIEAKNKNRPEEHKLNQKK